LSKAQVWHSGHRPRPTAGPPRPRARRDANSDIAPLLPCGTRPPAGQARAGGLGLCAGEPAGRARRRPISTRCNTVTGPWGIKKIYLAQVPREGRAGQKQEQGALGFDFASQRGRRARAQAGSSTGSCGPGGASAGRTMPPPPPHAHAAEREGSYSARAARRTVSAHASLRKSVRREGGGGKEA
jgi:hypothetical protein